MASPRTISWCLAQIEASPRVDGNGSIGVFFGGRVVGMRAERREALLNFLLEAVADDGTAAFPASVLAGLRRVVACETASYWEWTPQEVLESSLFADEPEVVSRVWGGYLQ